MDWVERSLERQQKSQDEQSALAEKRHRQGQKMLLIAAIVGAIIGSTIAGIFSALPAIIDRISR